MSFDINGSVTLIEVANVPESIKFYRTAFGLEVHQSAGDDGYIGWAWLRRGDVELMLNAMFEPGDTSSEPDPARVEAHRDTMIFIGCPDIDAAFERLKSLGITAEPPHTTHYGMKQLALRDPDGYGICLQWPAS